MTEFKLPELGENISQGDLVRLMVSPGASVTEGQPVMELETDKAVVEVPSSVTGVVKDIRVKEGEKIKVGQGIFTVETAPQEKPRKRHRKESLPRKQPQRSQLKKPKPGACRRNRGGPGAGVLDCGKRIQTSGAGKEHYPGNLVRLMVSPGSNIAEGQPVMELETDKAVVEVPSSVTGVVKDIRVEQGEKIKVGQVIFTLEAGASSKSQAKPESEENVSGQHGVRMSFPAAIAEEGKTEERRTP